MKKNNTNLATQEFVQPLAAQLPNFLNSKKSKNKN